MKGDSRRIAAGGHELLISDQAPSHFCFDLTLPSGKPSCWNLPERLWPMGRLVLDGADVRPLLDAVLEGDEINASPEYRGHLEGFTRALLGLPEPRAPRKK